MKCSLTARYWVATIGVIAVLGMADARRVAGKSAGSAAEPQWPSGVEIARRINARNDGTNLSQTLVMELIDRRGKKRVRETRSFRKYYGEERRSILFFESPRNIKGTGFLTLDYPDPERDDDQWLYLPAARKVRRISSSDRGGYFLGTDFTYEDMKKGGKVTIEDYQWKTVGEEKLGEHECFVVESVPVSETIGKDLGYGRVRSWVDRELWMIRRAEFWDINGNRLKTAQFGKFEQIDGIWTALRAEAENHKTGHRTVFAFEKVDYRRELPDELFTEQALRRGP